MVWLLLAVGCQHVDLEQGEIPCASDRDCPFEHHCVVASAPDRPAIAACSNTCATDPECPAGYFCGQSKNLGCNECVELCQTGGCDEGEACQPDGRCVFTLCTDADAPPCPSGWHCDPSAPSSEDEGAKPDPADETRVARGCARTRCDDPDGIVCTDLWRCDPTRSDFATGCFPLPCSETGRCSDDATYICEPNNDGPRVAGTDPHGCVHKNCGEGVPCDPAQICDAGACRQRTCAERSCASGSHCEQTENGNYCVPDAPSTAGTGTIPGNHRDPPGTCD